jgi:flagellar biosynthesis/type III secretory pathway protein FliH
VASNVTALWGEVISLRRDVEALKAELARRPQDNPVGQEEPSSDHAEPNHQPAKEAERKAENEKQVQEQVVRAQQQFASEQVDPGWSSAQRATIQGLANKNEGIRSALRGAECRSHTCRVELVDTAAANLGETLPTFLSEMGAALPRVTAERTTSADGTSSYVLYMTGGT